MKLPVVILDDATPGRQRLTRFRNAIEVIEAFSPGQVPPAFARIEQAVAQGRHVAGWVAYELGYVFEPRLLALQWPASELPLLSFGVFDAPEQIALGDLAPWGRAYAGPLRHAWEAEKEILSSGLPVFCLERYNDPEYKCLLENWLETGQL